MSAVRRVPDTGEQGKQVPRFPEGFRNVLQAWSLRTVVRSCAREGETVNLSRGKPKIKQRIIAAVIGAAMIVASQIATETPAQAGPGFALQTSDGGLFAGHAEAGGTIIWHDAKTFSVKIGRLADICPPDHAGAYLSVRGRRGDDPWADVRLVAADTTNCSDGQIISDTFGPFRAPDGLYIGAAQVLLEECNATPSGLFCSADPRDHVFSEWKWNPYR